MSTAWERMASTSLDPTEELLFRLEPSWADFVHEVRTGISIRRHPPTHMNLTGLVSEHEALESYRNDHGAGDKAAALWALKLCAKQNIPMPYWLADVVFDRIDTAQRKPVSLHDLFGLSKKLPAEGEKGKTKRSQWDWQTRLWSRVKELKQANPGSSLDALLKEARDELGFPFSQRHARDMFNVMESLQVKLTSPFRKRRAHIMR